ncbi:hypothetical protein Acr_02g0002810 [Actinidia rufa]|uniref:RING-type E3 ubiquitin transferase n=1 Tax=Actinidia rufa TaxID=165716 RepID=A0A7J0E6B5_9ERIC|nr:hypothetical protein Acr_02g0002810 [Actinidia rufa]
MSNLNLHLQHRHHRHLLDADPLAPPANGGRTRGSYSSEANFDTNNMVIILAALLCALICALGLNSIVRCALRCARRFSFETQNEAAVRLAATGLKKSTLRLIPVAVRCSSSKRRLLTQPMGKSGSAIPEMSPGLHGDAPGSAEEVS